MQHKQRSVAPTLLAAVLASASLNLWAQAGPSPKAAPTEHAHGAPAQRPHRGHLTDLKAKLQLQADQEAAWSTFSAAMAPPERATMAARQAQRAELMKLSTPERIDRMQSFHQQRQADMNAAMEKRGQATKAFYATLTAEQKKIFDEETARHMARSFETGPHPMRHHRG
jgi:Spy/CpxP family protein refolding chaperone